MLTRDASEKLNQQLSFYRRMIEAVERTLKRHNSDAYTDASTGTVYTIATDLLTPQGMYKTPSGENTRQLLYTLDLEKIDEIIKSKLPKLKALAAPNPLVYTSQQLIQLIQLPMLSAGLNIVALDQPSTEVTLNNHKPASLLEAAATYIPDQKLDDAVTNYLFSKFPYFIQYCGHLAKTTPQDENLIRAMALLIVYFGHEAKSNLKSSPDKIAGSGDKTSTSKSKEGAAEASRSSAVEAPKEFVFGTYAQLRNWHTLGEMLTSYYYVSALQSLYPEFSKHMLNLIGSGASEDEELKNLVKELKLGGSDNYDKFTTLREKIPNLQEVVLYTVNFACSGRPASIPVDAKITFRRDNEKVDSTIAQEIAGMVEATSCGWVPKVAPTENLLLVGGTASSKTTLLQSTIVQVKRAAANLGMVFDACSPLSNLLLQYYEQQYDNNTWQGATEGGERTSIQISLKQANNPSNVSYLVLNDIAGEHFEEMLMRDRDQNMIQSPLVHARYILFLFDLIAWRQLNAMLDEAKSEDTEGWKNFKKGATDQAHVGRAVVDSRDLMIKLIERLATASGASDGRKIDRTFILVIPKCDLYTQEGMFLNKWVQECVTAKYLKEVKEGETSLYMSTWNFKKPGENRNEFDAALSGISDMSVRASTAIKNLAKEVSTKGDGTEAVVSGDRVAVNIDSLLTYLEQTYTDVKVVPVSALGKAPPQQTAETASQGFTCDAVPLFCEALLLLPMLQMRATQTEGNQDQQEAHAQ